MKQKKTNDDGRLLAVLKALNKSKITVKKKTNFSKKLEMIFESALDAVERKAEKGTLTKQEIKAVLSLMKKFNIKIDEDN